MAVRDLLSLASPEDRKIMEGIMEGKSYEEIGRAIGLNKMDISRRMRAYAKMR